jgi:hypothetical protein
LSATLPAPPPATWRQVIDELINKLRGSLEGLPAGSQVRRVPRLPFPARMRAAWLHVDF